MSKEREALKMALDALEFGGWNMTTRVITALRERLAQTEQEPKCAHDVESANCEFCGGRDKQPEQEPDAPHWNSYKQGWEDGVVQERQRIVNLLMIQHETAKKAHNYWHVAAQLIQADVASDT